MSLFIANSQAAEMLPPPTSADLDFIAQDWLITELPQRAKVYFDAEQKEIVMANGLISRHWRTEPNGACVAFENLMSGTSMLRAVRPEAKVTLNGREFAVGGLIGQPNHAFLLPEWVDEMVAQRDSMKLVSYKTGPIEPRMEWKRVRHHAPDVEWPPRGVYLRMDYRKPDASALADDKVLLSDAGRKTLYTVKFNELTSLPPGWQVQSSKAHPRSSFENEGKTGEIYTPANTCVYAERSLPAGTRLVETTIDVGTDKSASWGPAIALVFSDRVIKFNVAPGAYDSDKKSAYGVFDGEREIVNIGKGEVKLEGPVKLRLRLEGSAVYCDAKLGDGSWKSFRRVALGAGSGEPAAVRVGKIGKSGGATDHSGEKGDMVRLRVMDVTAYGSVDPTALAGAESVGGEDDGVTVSVHYEMYDGIPLMSKWISVHNRGEAPVKVDRFTSEILAAVEQESWVSSPHGYQLPTPDYLHVESDYTFGGGENHESSNDHIVHWREDPEFTSQVHYSLKMPCLLDVSPDVGPGQTLKHGETFTSCRAFELVQDSTDRERRGLAVRRMYRTIAPWITENPMFHHMRNAKPDQVRTAIDQAAEVGFEMVILSFGSGFNIENTDPAYLQQWKNIAAYARSKGIDMGCYSLLSSRSVGGGNDVVSPPGQRPQFGRAPCLESKWGQEYFAKLYNFYDNIGFTCFEHDGNYPGDVCAATHHPGHTGLEDSQWNQWKMITDFYAYCRAKGVYLNVPDRYYLMGSNKCGMGYREVNWSLPRAQQVIHSRQNIYDGTWNKTPSMGWMFIPLTQYQGGGAAATVEPLHKHLNHYEMMLNSSIGLGVQSIVRGPRLFDTETTKQMLINKVKWYKKYRAILESDLVHGRRADGRDWDWMMHVNPRLEHKGMLMVFNPLKEIATRTLSPSLYYTGLTKTASIRREEEPPKTYHLKRDYSVDLTLTMEPESFTWLVIE